MNTFEQLVDVYKKAVNKDKIQFTHYLNLIIQNFLIENDDLIITIKYEFEIRQISKKNHTYFEKLMKDGFLFYKVNLKKKNETFKFSECTNNHFRTFKVNKDIQKCFKNDVIEEFKKSSIKYDLDNLKFIIENPKEAFKNCLFEISYDKAYDEFYLEFKNDYSFKHYKCFSLFTFKVEMKETEEEIEISDIILHGFDDIYLGHKKISLMNVIPNIDETLKIYKSNLLLKKLFRNRIKYM